MEAPETLSELASPESEVKAVAVRVSETWPVTVLDPEGEGPGSDPDTVEEAETDTAEEAETVESETPCDD